MTRVRIQFVTAWAAFRAGETDEVSGSLAQSLVEAGVAQYVPEATQEPVGGATDAAPMLQPAETPQAQPEEAPALALPTVAQTPGPTETPTPAPKRSRKPAQRKPAGKRTGG